MRILSMFVLSVLLSTGCAHTVKYKLTEADQWQGPKIDKTVRVQPFGDGTVPVTERTIKEGDFTFRTNYRARYKKKEIADGITQMLVKHLRYSGLFSSVVTASDSHPADYELSGTITEYYAQGRINKGAENTVMTGAILGGLAGSLLTLGATSGQKTDIQAHVNLADVTVRAADSTNILWQGSVEVSTNFTAHWAAADEPAVFVQADDCLKNTVAELINRLAAGLQTNAVDAPEVSLPSSTEDSAAHP